MRMPMVDIGEMRVRMIEALMDVRMAMRFATVPVIVRMLMVFVMNVPVTMRLWLVPMLMAVLLCQV